MKWSGRRDDILFQNDGEADLGKVLLVPSLPLGWQGAIPLCVYIHFTLLLFDRLKFFNFVHARIPKYYSKIKKLSALYRIFY